MADEKPNTKPASSTAKNALAVDPVEVMQQPAQDPVINIDAALYSLGRSVELRHAFSRSEQRAGRDFDTLDHYLARFNAFCNATPGGKP